MKAFLCLSLFALMLSACAPSLEATHEMPTDELNSEQGQGEADAPASEPPAPTGSTPAPEEALVDASEPVPYSNPVNDPRFAYLPDGRHLSGITVSGRKLALTKGIGAAFSNAKRSEYQALKAATQTDPVHKTQWVLMDLDRHRIASKSLSSHKKLFGASSSKVYVGAALLDRKSGALSNTQLQLMADMLVVSSNSAWTELQRQVGDGDANKGRERIHAFTQRMGYRQTRGFQGYWGSLHGNELTPDESVETLYDIYRGAFPGAALLWKVMHACRTGAARGLKYIPSNIYVGGKTGTYDGPTENPETGQQYNVAIRNHLLVFNAGGTQYGLAILSNAGNDESVAVLTGGLIREYAGVP